jgi:CMP-N-acetylneuraminic acid synthetase
MKNVKDTLFIIQARTQSTRVPNKMLRPFDNSNLFEIAINKVLKSKTIPRENFYLSIMDQELVDIANKYNVNYFTRSEESTQEPVTLQKVFEWHTLPFKHFVIINACNPLLRITTIDNFVGNFLETHSNGLFGVFEKKTFLFNNEGAMINKFFGEDKYLATLETKFVETCYEAAHSLYAGSTEDIKNGIYMGNFKEPKNPEFFIMDEIECFDIDWPWQFEVAERLYKSNDFNTQNFL